MIESILASSSTTVSADSWSISSGESTGRISTGGSSRSSTVWSRKMPVSPHRRIQWGPRPRAYIFRRHQPVAEDHRLHFRRVVQNSRRARHSTRLNSEESDARASRFSRCAERLSHLGREPSSSSVSVVDSGSRLGPNGHDFVLFGNAARRGRERSRRLDAVFKAIRHSPVPRPSEKDPRTRRHETVCGFTDRLALGLDDIHHIVNKCLDRRCFSFEEVVHALCAAHPCDTSSSARHRDRLTRPRTPRVRTHRSLRSDHFLPARSSAARWFGFPVPSSSRGSVNRALRSRSRDLGFLLEIGLSGRRILVDREGRPVSAASISAIFWSDSS